jgi:hypothetical protein
MPKARVIANSLTPNAAFPSQIPGMQYSGAPLNPLPQPGVVSVANGTDQGSATDLYDVVRLGYATINPVTGAIRVQAPRWMLDEIDAYIRQIVAMYDTVITYEGMLVLATYTNGHREDLDLRAFGKWAGGRYGAVLSNTAAGGVTVSFADGLIPTATAGAQALSGPLLGIVSQKDGLSLFNDYVQTLNNYSVKGRIKVTTSSGVPATNSTLEPLPFQLVQQSTATGNSGAAQQATNYPIQYMNFGTVMSVNPRYDLATGKVRGLVQVHNSVYAGEKQFNNQISLGSQYVNQVTSVPLPKTMDLLGETQLRDGELIILGGKTPR